MMYGELSFFHPFERFPDTLQRLDFIVFDLIPTLSLPFYLAYIVLLFGADTARFLAAIYLLLLWISILNMALAFAMFNRSIGLFGLGAALIFPFYQGVYLKCGCFVSYSSEIIFAASRYDDFVPPRVRRALFGGRSLEEASPMNVTINRLDPNVPDPVESRRRAAGRMVRIAYATIVFGMLAFFVIYFGAPFIFLGGPGTVSSPRQVVSLPYTVQVSHINLVPGATVKAGEEIGQVVSPEQDSIVATYMRALADIAGRTAELRIKARVAQEVSRSRALLFAGDRGSGGTNRRHVHGHGDLPHGSLARARHGAQSRHFAGSGSRRVRRSTCLSGRIYPSTSRPPR